MKNIGIHGRLLMAAFVMIAAATFTLHMIAVHITGKFIHKRFKDRISFLARYLAENSEVYVLMDDRSSLKSLAHNLMGEEDVARVAIFNHDGIGLVDLSKPIHGALSYIETPVMLKKSVDENLLYAYGEGAGRNGTSQLFDIIGKVRIDYRTKGIENLMRDLNRKFIFASLGLVAVAGSAFFFLSRPIVVEVTQLAATARQIGRGDKELRAVPGRVPETRELAVAFNVMLDSLNASRISLERVNREVSRHKALAERGKFSLMVAHEVKNPLGIIKSSLDILKKDLSIPSDNLMVVYMEDEIKRLNTLIEDFLLFARPADPLFRQVDLNALLNEIADRFEIQNGYANNHLVRRIPEESCTAQVDMDLFSRALSNIVKNAYEAGGEAGEVCIQAQIVDNMWTAEIIDSGEGIVEENLFRIFEPFFTTRSKGTGLGLAFANQVIRAHGGTVRAMNYDKGGAMFQIEIPLNQGPVES